MNPGTGVIVASRCSLNGRTGIVTEMPPAWPDWRRVELDPVPGKASWGILPVAELRVHARPGPAQGVLL